MMPDAVSPTAGGSEVVTPDAGAHRVPDQHILAPAAGGSEVVTPDAGAHCVPDRHILAPAAGGSEVVMPDAGHIVCQLDIFWRQLLDGLRS